MTTHNECEWDAEAVIRQAKAIERAAQEAAREAILEHKRNGNPIVICVGDEVRWIPADQINADGTIGKG